MQKLIIGSALALSLAFAAAASADSFDTFHTGSVDGQFGWKATGSYDQEVATVDGHKKLRISNADTSGSFADMPYSAPVAPAGENVDHNVLTNEFTFKTATQALQPGLAVSVSPTGDGGSRMSYVRLEDGYDGVRVFFRDATFNDKWIATLNRQDAHKIKFVTTFVPGYDNDVVRVFVDGEQKVCGTSWENYYRFDEQHDPSVTDRLMWRLNVDPATQQQRDDLRGKGFLFDDVTSSSDRSNEPAGCTLPVGPQGPAGDNGKDGTNGAPGATAPADGSGATAAAAGVSGAKVKMGATKRTLHVQSAKGMKLISERVHRREVQDQERQGPHRPQHAGPERHRPVAAQCGTRAGFGRSARCGSTPAAA
jgi:hypothetical protein